MATAEEVLAEVRNIAQLLVGTGSSIDDPNWAPGGNSIMGTVRNTAAHLYAGGPSAADPEYLGAPGTIYNLAKTPVDRGAEGKFSQIQEIADAKTVAMRSEKKVDQLLERPAAIVSDAQVKAIADAVAAQLGKSSTTLDYAAISKAVNDERDSRERKRLG